MTHYPVLRLEAEQWLNIRENGTYVDATCGQAGHSRFLLEKHPGIRLIGIDKDAQAVVEAREKLQAYPNFRVFHGGFETLTEILQAAGIKEMEGILFDLGFSTRQVKDPCRGFSLYLEGPLDMRYDRTSPLTAEEIVNTWSRQKLIGIFRDYGEVRRPERIVDRIVERRREKRFETTLELSGFLARIVRRRKKVHPATVFFQALRIAVNNELEVLKEGLKQAQALLKSRGRIVVITFHSLEDRIVKWFFRTAPDLKNLTKKPIRPSRNEVLGNPESRSAKLRAAEKL